MPWWSSRSKHESLSVLLAMPTGLSLAYRAFTSFDRAFERQAGEFEKQRPHRVARRCSFELARLHDLMVDGDGCTSGEWDLFLCSTDWLPRLIDEGKLRPLDSYLQSDPPENWPQGWPASLLGLQRDRAGRTYGIAYHDGPEMLLYRKDLFENPEEIRRFRQVTGRPLLPPATWAELAELSRFFSRPGEGLSGCVLAAFPDAHNTVYDFLLQLWSRGGELFDQGRAAFHRKAGCKGLAFLARLIDDGLTQPNPREFDSVRAGEHYAAGRAALMWNWSGFSIVAELPGSPIRGRTGLARIPRGEQKQASHVSLSAYWVLTIPAGSRHPDQAWQFIRSTASAAMDRVTAVEGGNGCRLSTWGDPELQARFPCYQIMEDVHAQARTLPALAEVPQIMAILGAAIDRVYRHDQPAAAALADAAVAVDDLVARKDPWRG